MLKEQLEAERRRRLNEVCSRYSIPVRARQYNERLNYDDIEIDEEEAIENESNIEDDEETNWTRP